MQPAMFSAPFLRFAQDDRLQAFPAGLAVHYFQGGAENQGGLGSSLDVFGSESGGNFGKDEAGGRDFEISHLSDDGVDHAHAG